MPPSGRYVTLPRHSLMLPDGGVHPIDPWSAGVNGRAACMRGAVPRRNRHLHDQSHPLAPRGLPRHSRVNLHTARSRNMTFSTTPHWSELILLPSFRRMLVATDRLTRADWNATSHDVQKDGLKEDKSKSKRQIPWIPASAGMTNQNRQTLPHWSRQTLAPHSRLTFISRQTLPHWSEQSFFTRV